MWGTRRSMCSPFYTVTVQRAVISSAVVFFYVSEEPVGVPQTATHWRWGGMKTSLSTDVSFKCFCITAVCSTHSPPPPPSEWVLSGLAGFTGASLGWMDEGLMGISHLPVHISCCIVIPSLNVCSLQKHLKILKGKRWSHLFVYRRTLELLIFT